MFIAEFFRGLRAYPQAHRLLRDHGLRRYLLLPGLLSTAYVVVVLLLAAAYAGDVSAYITANWVPGFMQSGILAAVTGVLVWLLVLVLVFLTYKHVVLIVLAPVLGTLSERVEQAAFGTAVPQSSFAEIASDLWRGLRLNLYLLLRELLWTALAYAVGFIPILGAFIAPPAIFGIQAYYGGIGLVDAALERRRYGTRETLAFARQHRARMLGVGAGFVLLLVVPVLGWFLAPCYGTAAGTLSTVEQLRALEAPAD